MYKGTIFHQDKYFFIYTYNIDYGNKYNIVINLYGWINYVKVYPVYKTGYVTAIVLTLISLTILSESLIKSVKIARLNITVFLLSSRSSFLLNRSRFIIILCFQHLIR